jgi:uncharacterized protein YraI
MQPTVTLLPTNTPIPTATSVPVAVVATPTPTIIPIVVNGNAEYQVVFVSPNDTLNMRAGAGVDNAVVGEMRVGNAGIFLNQSANRTNIAGSDWVQITQNGTTGWVNSRYLTEAIAGTTFCNDPASRQLLDTFVAEMSNPTTLSQSINADRGLRVHLSWWNPEVWITNAELTNAFTSPATADWGVADGTGDPLVGTFNQMVLPKIERDLTTATQIGCNEILHGGTAGYVKLPDEYAGINYYSLHRPPTAGNELDWGTWVIGIEKWDGAYFVSFMVHYQWEI